MESRMTFDEVVKAVPDLKAIGIKIARQFCYEDIEGIQLAYKAALKLSQMDIEHTSQSAFIAVCVKNHFMDLYRCKRRFSSTENLGELCDEAYGCGTVNDDIGFFGAITECLDDEIKSIVFDKYVYGMEEPELAMKYNVERGTIKSRLNRANAKMKQSKFCQEMNYAMV